MDHSQLISAKHEDSETHRLEKLVRHFLSSEEECDGFERIVTEKTIIIREVGLGSCMVVPLFSWGNILGYIGVYKSVITKDWSEKDSDHLYSVGQVLSFALHRRYLWDESHRFFNESSDLLCIFTRADKMILKMNMTFKNLLSLDQKDVNISILSLVHPSDRMRLEYHLDSKGTIHQSSDNIRLRMISDDRELKWVEMVCNASTYDSMVYCIARDVTNEMVTLMDLKRRQMKYRLEEGHIYLEKQQVHPGLIDVIGDLVEIGYLGYIFSRDPNPDGRTDNAGNPRHYWLAESDSDSSVSSSIDLIQTTTMGFPKRSVVLFDRLDYLIVEQGFNEVMSFLHRLGEMAYLNELIVLISIDPRTISSQQLRMIELECTDLQPVHNERLSSELLDLLRIAHIRSLSNLTTSYEDFTKELRISKPTARKRLATLVYIGYMSMCLVGRKKVFSITDKGYNLLSG